MNDRLIHPPPPHLSAPLLLLQIGFLLGKHQTVAPRVKPDKTRPGAGLFLFKIKARREETIIVLSRETKRLQTCHQNTNVQYKIVNLIQYYIISRGDCEN